MSIFWEKISSLLKKPQQNKSRHSFSPASREAVRQKVREGGCGWVGGGVSFFLNEWGAEEAVNRWVLPGVDKLPSRTHAATF